MQLLSIPNRKPSDASIICKYNFLRSRIQGDGQIKTTVETLEAVQEDIREKMAIKVDIYDLRAELGKKVKSNESRIENLEEHTDISNPHKN